MSGLDRGFYFFWGTLFFCAVLTSSSFSYNVVQYKKIQEQAVTLDIWKNCPMPPGGFWLIVESNWVGKKSNEQLRCSFARQPASAPLRSPRVY